MTGGLSAPLDEGGEGERNTDEGLADDLAGSVDEWIGRTTEDAVDYATRADDEGPPQSTYANMIDRDRLERYNENNPEHADDYEYQPEDAQDLEFGDLQSLNGDEEGGTTTTNVPDAAEEAANDAADVARNLGPEWLDEGMIIVLALVAAFILAPYAELGNSILSRP